MFEYAARQAASEARAATRKNIGTAYGLLPQARWGGLGANEEQ
jgi:hypothetical protein